MKRPFRLESRSAAETKKLAESLGRCLAAGDVVTLRGELGSGKTTFAKGLAKALGVRSESEVSSPTFVTIHEYEGRIPVYHLDWYRLSRVEGTDRELAEECIEDDGVTLIEWPERGASMLPDERVDVRIFHRGRTNRTIEVCASGRSASDRLARWAKS